jgi:hypothetical protein
MTESIPAHDPQTPQDPTSTVADTPDAASGIYHETPKTRPRGQRPKSRLHPTPEALDALQEVLMRFSGDLLEKYILKRWVAPDRHNRRRQRDPTLPHGDR